MKNPKRGELWIVKLDPTQGSETKKTRPCLVLSNDKRNNAARIVTVIPITSGEIVYPSIQVRLDKSMGLANLSYLDIPQVRVADKMRLVKKIGSITPDLFQELFIKLNIHFGFSQFLR